ncbi:MAG: HipA N-terminal domain-containing protein [Verrucomicrobia bacterium]|nr:HipA N-terminal domain-containing protein [Verrucomicrobiota bacterium]MBS0636253.1 HipA N-terminal domain-containing protein [Verrucomicrobiota bacterium]
MKRAKVYVDGVFAGHLEELEMARRYRFSYDPEYTGPSVSLEMPTSERIYEYDRFPPFFEGLLPEGIMLEGLLRQAKLDRDDYMSQLIVVGHDLVGNVTVEEAT